MCKSGLFDRHGQEFRIGHLYVNIHDPLEDLFEVRFLHGAFCGGAAGQEDDKFMPMAWMPESDIDMKHSDTKDFEIRAHITDRAYKNKPSQT